MTDLFEQSAAEYKSANPDPFEEAAKKYNSKDPFVQAANQYKSKFGLEEVTNLMVPEDKAINFLELEKTKEFGRLVQDPMGIAAGGLEFVSAIPGFITGLVGAAQNIVKAYLGGAADLEDLYISASEGFKRESEKLPPYQAEGHPESHFVGEVAMSPATLIMHGGEKFAEQIDDPVARGAVLFAKDILALAGQAKIMHGGEVAKGKPTKGKPTGVAESEFLKKEFEAEILGKEQPVVSVVPAKKYERVPTTLKGPEIAPKGKYTDLGEYERVPTTLEGPKIAPKGKYADLGEYERIPTNQAEPKIIKESVEKRHGVGTLKKTESKNILYSGIPPSEFLKIGNLWTKYVGEPIWDKLIMKEVPKLLAKVPGGKSINRAMIYDWRGDLKGAPEYIKSMEEMTYRQAVSREYALDIGNRLQGFPEESQLKIGEYITGQQYKNISGVGKLKKFELTPEELKIANEAVDVLAELGKQAVDQGLLSEEAFFKNTGRYMPRLYKKYEYKTLLERWGLTKPNRLDLQRFKARKDIPKEIRQQMGEILTPGYPVAKGIIQLTHDIELAKFFSGIAKNPDWAIPKSAYQPASAWIEPAPIPEGYKFVGRNPKLGQLNEAYVHPEIFADLQEAVRQIDMPERVWIKSLGYWKFGKVILSPKTHVRNMFSNSILAHLGGLPMYEQPYYLAKAAKAMMEKGEYWKVGKQTNLLRTTFTNAELRSLFDQVDLNIEGVRAGSVVDYLGEAGKAWDYASQKMQEAAKLYEAEEQWFKMAKMIHNMERKGMDARLAAADAEKWLFNYGKVTKFQDKYRRKWYGAPFATFTFKALPRVAEAAIKTPWRFALPAAIIYGLEKSASNLIGDTPEQREAKREMQPEWQKGGMLGIRNFPRVPFVDDYGREHFLNLTYILPWGDIGEGGDFMGIPGSIRPFSMPFINEPIQQIFNRDIFWKSDIVKAEDVAGLPGSEGKSPGEIWNPLTEAGRVAWAKRGEHMVQSLAPTPVIDIQKGIQSLQGKMDSRGRIRDPKIVAADVLLGVKMYPVDYADELQKYLARMSPDRGEVASKIQSQIKIMSRKKAALEKAGKSTKYYDEQINKKIEQLFGMAKEVKEKSTTFRKIGE